MLERYCAALDIKLFDDSVLGYLCDTQLAQHRRSDDSFYGGKTAIINTIQKLAPGSPVMSLQEAQKHTLALTKSL
jgi:hypothetical protein